MRLFPEFKIVRHCKGGLPQGAQSSPRATIEKAATSGFEPIEQRKITRA
jgi:hypothetical protein